MMKLITWEFNNAIVHIEFDTEEVSDYWKKQNNLEIDGIFDEYHPEDELSGNRIYWGWYSAYNDNYVDERELLPSKANVTVVMKGV